MTTESRIELTLRAIVLGVVLTVVFTAANVYFGLKAGLTFSTSIPAVVISMAMLRWLGNTSAQENNIVQTVASTAGTLSSIIFVLPGFIMIGWWSRFSLLAVGRHLRHRRHPRSHVLHPAAPRAGDGLGSALSRRHRLRRGHQGRFR